MWLRVHIGVRESRRHWAFPFCGSSGCLCVSVVDFSRKTQELPESSGRNMSLRAALPSEKKGWISCASNDFHSFNHAVSGVECEMVTEMRL